MKDKLKTAPNRDFGRIIALFMSFCLTIILMSQCFPVDAIAAKDVDDPTVQEIYNVIPDDSVTANFSGEFPEGSTVKMEPVENSQTAEFVGSDDRVETVLHAYDITIYDDAGDAFQPEAGTPVTVTLTSPEITEALESGKTLTVLHIPDEGEPEEMEVLSSENGVLVFTATGFSVFVILEHEGDTTKTPRYIYHFIGYEPDENADGSTVVYTAAPYTFRNKKNELQTTQIITDGEELELIENPPNKSGTTDAYFYGWYIVEMTNTTKDADGAVNRISYRWTENPERLVFEEPISVKADRDIWVAPIYKDYEFVNFHCNAWGASNATELITRKMVVLGSNQSTDVRISDVRAESTDPTHLVFVGWETRSANGTSGDFYDTVDTFNNENETSMTVSQNNLVDDHVDLYPVFEEARWIYFNTGSSGNGSNYVPAQFALTSDVSEHPITKLEVPTRVGYEFEGWYISADSYGNGTGVQITDKNGNFVENYTYPSAGTSEYKIQDGKMYVYRQMETVTFYAKWKSSNASYYIYYYKQNVNDSDYTLTSFDIINNKSSGEMTDAVNDANSSNNTGGTKDLDTYLKNEHYHLNTTDHAIQNQVISPNGNTVVNVYYDLDEYTLRFFFARQYTYNNTNYVQVNNNDEYFNTAGRTDIQNALTGWVTNDFKRIGGSNTWKTVKANSAEDLVKNSYLTANSLSVGKVTYSNVSTYVFTSAGTASLQTVPYVDYYYIDVKAKYGQSLLQLWPGAANLNSQQMDSAHNPNANQNSTYNDYGDYTPTGNINPLFYHRIGNGGDLTNYGYVDDNLLVTTQTVGDTTYQYFLMYWRFQSTYSYAYKVYFSPLSGETTDATYNGSSYVYQEDKSVVVVNGTILNDVASYAINGFDVKAIARSTSGSGTINGVTYSNGEIRVYYQRKTENINYHTQTDTGDTVYNDTTQLSADDSSKIGTFGEKMSLYAPDSYNYQIGTTERIANDGTAYRFKGWYDNPSGQGTPYTFPDSDTMGTEAQNFYAVWEKIQYIVQIDPNGAEIDHIDHTGASYSGYGVSVFNRDWNNDSTYNRSRSTYFGVTTNEKISEYSLQSPQYIKMTADEAAAASDDDTYYYLYTAYRDTDYVFSSHLRNALYLKESDFQSYYNFYVTLTLANNRTLAINDLMSYDEWLSTYVDTSKKYRKCKSNEHYTFLGWYQVDSNGTVATTPFDFNDPATGDTTLRAVWRLDTPYYVEYDPIFKVENGPLINGNVSQWRDPKDTTLYYSESAPTNILEQPTGITADGVATQDYIFRGWRIVKGNSDAYIPVEPGVYYNPGEEFTILNKYADETGKIQMQAYYEYVDASARRPYITNLRLDANTCYGGKENAEPVPEWKADWESSPLVGTVTRSDSGTQIHFGDIQSDRSIHLYQYATELEEDSAGNPLTPAGRVMFDNEYGDLLLGFDPQADPADYIPEYAADAVIGITRDSSELLYAMWEPMVYLNFENQTNEEITFTLGCDSPEALYVVNEYISLYQRQQYTMSNNQITLPAGGSLKLVLPKGDGKNVTVSGTNTLSPGNFLTVTAYDTDWETVVNQQESIARNKSYSVSDTLKRNKDGIKYVFTAERKAVLTYNNMDGDDADSSATWDHVFEAADLDASYTTEIPARLGYTFGGWASTEQRAKNKTADITKGQTFNPARTIFTSYDTDNDSVVTLYAIWTPVNNAIYVAKKVTGAGDPDMPFEFTVTASGNFSGNYTYQSGGWFSRTVTDSFSSVNYTAKPQTLTLKDGEYFTISNIVADKPSYTGRNITSNINVTITKYDKNGEKINTTTSTILTGTASVTNNVYNVTSVTPNITITVSEADYSSEFYRTSLSIDNADTVNKPLKNGDDGRSFYFSDLNASGVVTFTNHKPDPPVTDYTTETVPYLFLGAGGLLTLLGLMYFMARTRCKERWDEL